MIFIHNRKDEECMDNTYEKKMKDEIELKEPGISVVMPMYNAERYLEKSIESVLNQTYENFEFIIIDDGSEDDSFQIAQKYADKDRRIKLYEQPHCGVAITLNKGIAIANADIIARQDADDMSDEKRFEKQLGYLEKHPEIYLLGTNAVLIDATGKRIRDLEFHSTNEELQKEIVDNNPFIHGSVMMRKSCFEKIGMYREQFVLCQSYDLWLRISEQFKIGILNSKLYYYRVWEDAISYKGVAINNTLKEIIKKYAAQRRKTGYDDLMRNNSLFYMQYGKEIMDAYNKEDVYHWLSEQ